MKKKIFVIVTGTCIILCTFWNNVSFQKNMSLLTLANIEALADESNESSNKDECKGLSESGYGKYYSLHEISCTIKVTVGVNQVSYEKGVKNKCKLEKPCNPNASCSSSSEKACHKS